MGLFKKKEKVNKVKSALPQKIFKVVLWVILSIIFLRGIGTYFKPNDASTAKTVIEAYKQGKDYSDQVSFEATAFARMFAMEYLTFKGDNSDYDDRLKKYSNLDFVGNFKDKVEALGSEAYKIEWRGKDKLNVDVKVKVRYTVKPQEDDILPKPGEAPKPDIITVKDTCIRIPLYVSDGKYLVEDYPVFIPEPSKGAKPEKNKQGKDVSNDVKGKLQSAVENFIKTYCNGNSVEMSYYLADTSKTENGLNKRYIFKKLILEEFNARELDGGKYLITTQYEVQDSINNQVFKQSMQITITVKDNKYLIDSFDAKLN